MKGPMMKVKVGSIGKDLSVKCPNCGTRRYIEEGGVVKVKQCWFCTDDEFEVHIHVINEYGACEAERITVKECY